MQCTQGKQYEDQGRDQGDVVKSQETSRLTENHQKVGERHGTDSS